MAAGRCWNVCCRVPSSSRAKSPCCRPHVPSCPSRACRWSGSLAVEMPERLPAAMRWTGQGSLVAPRVPMIAWRGPDGRQQAVDESTLSIAGLVRSEVEFAGAAIERSGRQPADSLAGAAAIGRSAGHRPALTAFAEADTICGHADRSAKTTLARPCSPTSQSRREIRP